MKSKNKIMILLLLIIVLQNLGLLIKNQKTIKQMLTNTNFYINGTIGTIDDLIEIEIKGNSETEDIENLEKSINLCRYYMLLTEGSLDGYRVNINENLEPMHGYISEHQEIFARMLKDNILDEREKEYLGLVKEEFNNYAQEMNNLHNKLFISVKDVNKCTLKIDNLAYKVPPQPFGYIERYNKFINSKI